MKFLHHSFAVRRVLWAAYVSATVVVTSTPVLAQTNLLANSATSTLPSVVVTATRSDLRLDQLVSDVTVIDRAQLENFTEHTLPELLSRTAGVQMSANGGAGTLSGVMLRGTESRHTLLLIDGVRYGSLAAGAPAWENIPVDMIERIEVLQGAASSLYGSDAAGGVVQIFTRQGKQGLLASAAITRGSHGYNRLNAGVQGGSGALTYSLQAQQLEDKGFSATNVKEAFGNFNPDRDGFFQNTFNGTVAWQISKDWKLDAGLLYADGLSHFDDGPTVDSRSVLRMVTAHTGLQGKLLDNLKSQISIRQSKDTNNGIAASYGADGFKSTQKQITWQNEMDTSAGVILFGLEQLKQSLDSSVAYDQTKRTIHAGFVGLNGNAGSHSWQMNLRRDANSQFGQATTGFAGYGYQISPEWRLNASYGTSFVAPSFNLLYYPNFSNPLLQPERGGNGEVGVHWSAQNHSVKLVHFLNRIRGFITNTTTPENIPRARIEGTTLSYSSTVGAVGLRAAIDYLDAENEGTHQRLARRARVHGTVSADYTTGYWTIGASALHVGDRYDDAANFVPLAAYTTGDMYANYRVSPNVRLQVKLNNVANKQYETAYGYNQPGREIYVGLRFAMP